LAGWGGKSANGENIEAAGRAHFEGGVIEDGDVTARPASNNLQKQLNKKK
jgi:hypothetical protein